MSFSACGWVPALAAEVPAAGAGTEVRNFADLYRLSQTAAQAGHPFRIQGVVLCYDLGWDQLYVHDGNDTVYFKPSSFSTNLHPGHIVEITGRTTWREGTVQFTNYSIAVLGERELPPAKAVGLSQMAHDFGRWVEIRGCVRTADSGSGRLSLVIEDQGETCLIFVLAPPKDHDPKWLLGAQVKIRGINASKLDKGRLHRAWLFAPSLAEIKIIEPSKESSLPPVTSIESLLDRELGSWTNAPVHLHGLVLSYQAGDHLEIQDPTGKMRALVVQLTEAKINERVDLWGYLAASTAETVLKSAWFEATPSLNRLEAATPSHEVSSPSNSPAATLTRISEIQSLTPEQAARRHPVRVRGVITYADAEWHNAFLQDRDGAVYVDLRDSSIRPGHYCEVIGETSPGGFAPDLVNATFRILGTTNLPVAARVDLEDLADGRLDASWVRMEGVVRRVQEQWGHATLVLTSRKGRFKVVVPQLLGQPATDRLIDALVTVQGACSSELNDRRQLAGITLHTPSLDHIEVQERVAGDPFSVLASPIGGVATFDPGRLAGRRVKIHGTVTLAVPGDRFFIQDASGGIQVRTQQTNEVQVGDALDVLGFPSLGDFSPSLEEGVFRRIGIGPVAPANRTSASEVLLGGTNDAMLVELEARLVQTMTRSARPKLVLQDGPIIFTAHLVSSPGPESPLLAAGSLVRVRGICVIQGGESHQPLSFRLLLREPEDVKLLSTPPWWTSRHARMLTGGMVLAVLIALAWVASLRAQVRAQTRIIERRQSELLEISHQVGMVEVATSVLHNVGNVLNSVNVSATLVSDQLKESKLTDVSRVAVMLREHSAEIGEFLTQDPRGRQIPAYLLGLGEHLVKEQAAQLDELNQLRQNIDHIKDIVSMQQSYARVSGLTEQIKVTELVEDALRLSEGALERHRIQVFRDFESPPHLMTIEKHKALQILVNLISNAKHACDESLATEKRLELRVLTTGGNVCISVGDNGVGIAPENLTRIFNLGFTTRKSGHGIGLHSSALAARDLGGALRAHSDGLGRGATFTLELPLSPKI
jgi:signal transduction histidine kinase